MVESCQSSTAPPPKRPKAEAPASPMASAPGRTEEDSAAAAAARSAGSAEYAAAKKDQVGDKPAVAAADSSRRRKEQQQQQAAPRAKLLPRRSQSASHGGQPCSIFKAFAMAHKGKATSDVDYNPEDGLQAYSNATVHNRLSEYTSMAREVHGPEYDPSTEDLDGEVVMRVGGGKKHGRYWIGDGAIDSAATPSLSQIRARASSTSTSPAIRPRQDTSHHRVEALEAQLEQVRRIREQMQAKMERVGAERQAEQRRMAEILQYMQSLSAATGVAPPPSLFAPPPPPPPPPYYSTPNQSAGSNDPHASVNPSPNQSHWPSW